MALSPEGRGGGARETSRVVSYCESREGVRGGRRAHSLAGDATRTEERANVSFARASSDDRVVDPARIATGVTTREGRSREGGLEGEGRRGSSGGGAALEGTVRRDGRRRSGHRARHANARDDAREISRAPSPRPGGAAGPETLDASE